MITFAQKWNSLLGNREALQYESVAMAVPKSMLHTTAKAEAEAAGLLGYS